MLITDDDYDLIPARTLESLERWVNHGIPTGHFLRAVLTNDLMGAFGRADAENLTALPVLVRLIYNRAPAGSWGSESICDAWQEHHGREFAGVRSLGERFLAPARGRRASRDAG